MKNKQFKTLDEQIEILRHKGLIIKDIEYAKQVLLRESYFFLSGYRHLFMNDDVPKTYIEGSTFEELYSLFLFDRSFRNIIFKNLLIIENNTKSIIAYQLSKKYGYKESEYLRPANFDTTRERYGQVNDLIKKMKRQIRANGPQHSATMHYISNYGYIPLWVLVKVLSFGIVSELYSILKIEDRIAIAKSYDLNHETYTGYLPLLANYRNLCAHEDILFENRTNRRIDDTIFHRLLKVEEVDGEYKYGKNDLFALIIIMRQLLSATEVKNMVIEIDRELSNLSMNLNSFEMERVLNRMGFPANWKDIANIERG